MLKKSDQLPQLILILGATFLIGGCDIIHGLSGIDLANVFFESSCGQYTFHDKKGTERCGTGWDSFGFLYQKDQIASILLSHDSEASSDYTPNFQIWFDSRYLKTGETLGPAQARAQCSRFKPELDNGDSTYYTTNTNDFSLKIVEDLGLREEDILDDQSRWVFEWNINCPDLEMSAQGKDQLDLNLNPIPASWARAGNGPPPEYTSTQSP